MSARSRLARILPPLVLSSLAVTFAGCPRKPAAPAKAPSEVPGALPMERLAFDAAGWDMAYEPALRVHTATRVIPAPNSSTYLVRVFVGDRKLPATPEGLAAAVVDKKWLSSSCGWPWLEVKEKAKLEDGAWVLGRVKDPSTRRDELHLVVTRVLPGGQIGAWTDDLHNGETVDAALALVKSARVP